MLGCAPLQRSLLWKGEPFLGSQPGLQELLCPWQPLQLGEALCFSWFGKPGLTVAATSSLPSAHLGTAGSAQPGTAQPEAKDLSATGPDYIKTMFKEVKPENSL